MYFWVGLVKLAGLVCFCLLGDRHVLFDCGIRVNRTGAEALPDLELAEGECP